MHAEESSCTEHLTQPKPVGRFAVLALIAISLLTSGCAVFQSLANMFEALSLHQREWQDLAQIRRELREELAEQRQEARREEVQRERSKRAWTSNKRTWSPASVWESKRPCENS